jgi:Protein of unknown function (DUF2970)
VADQRPGKLGKVSPLRVFRTVFWSFFGVRRRADNQADLADITPVQVIIAGIIGAGIFVTTLILLVRFIVG